MKLKLATIALVATTLHALPAQAHPVAIYGATPQFAAEVGRYYDEAPKAFRDKLGNPIVMAFTTTHTMAVLWQAWGLLPPQVAAEYARSSNSLWGIARYMYDTKKTYLGMIFQKDRTEQDVKRVVFHEMAHLYDFFDSKPGTGMSEQGWFRRAYDADKKEALALWKSRKDYRAEIDSYAHYLKAPKEAFAEAVARVLLPPSNSADRNNFEKVLFPSVMAVVTAKLAEDGIIAAKQPRITMEH